MKTYGSPMPFLMFIFLTAGIVYIVSFSGCNNTVTSTVETKTNKAYSEKDFKLERNLRAIPESVIALNLEDINSPPNDSIPDTGTIGEDIVFFRYTENVTRSFRMEKSSRFSVSLTNTETGAGLYYIDWYNDNVTVYIPAGDYRMNIHSWQDYSTDSALGRQQIFIKSEDQSNVLITTAGCLNCDLSFINLDYMNLNYMNFGGANLNNASLARTSLIGTNFSNANLNKTYFYKSNMVYADLSHSFMQGVILRSTDLKHANIGGSDITNGDLRFADISFANFCGSNLIGIISNGITANAETQCWP